MEGALKADVSNWAAEPAGLSDLWLIDPRPTRSFQNLNIEVEKVIVGQQDIIQFIVIAI